MEKRGEDKEVVVSASKEFVDAANTIMDKVLILVKEHQKLMGYVYLDKPEIGQTKTLPTKDKCGVEGCKKYAMHTFSFINRRFRCCNFCYDKVNEIHSLANRELLDLQMFWAEEMREAK